MKRTKIVCTIGPASASLSKLQTMMKSGMDVARLNFSHGTHAGHKKLFRLIRSASKKTDRHVPIIGDLQGPKIRLGALPDGLSMKTGETVVFSTSEKVQKDNVFPVTYKNLHKDVKRGHRLLIDDGLIEAKITNVRGSRITTKVVNGGPVSSHKGMNFPDSNLSVSAITKKDREDVKFGCQLGVDWVALSFVTDAKDVKTLRRLIKQHTPEGMEPARIIVKIEKHEAIDRFDEILDATDAIMVARGDLGVEIDAEEVPVRQKEIIEKSRHKGKPVVVATQMLDSMIRNPRPTRAEVSDVANAVFDHTDAVMLSGESATGKYPVKTVRIMSRIVKEAEESPFDDIPLNVPDPLSIETSAAHAIKLLAYQETIDGVLASYDLAPWSEKVLKAHPEIPFFLGVSSARLARQTSLRWGVIPFVVKNPKEATFVKRAIARLRKKHKARKGMRLAVVLGGIHGEGFDIVSVEK
jgi:pyruvate kinase